MIADKDRFHSSIYDRLSPIVRERLDALLGSAETDRVEEVPGSRPAVLLTLRGNPGRPSLASMQAV